MKGIMASPHIPSWRREQRNLFNQQARNMYTLFHNHHKNILAEKLLLHNHGQLDCNSPFYSNIIIPHTFYFLVRIRNNKYLCELFAT